MFFYTQKSAVRLVSHEPGLQWRRVVAFEYTYKWWRGNCENSPLPTIGSAFQCVKGELLLCVGRCTCKYILKGWFAHFFFFFFFFFLLKKVNIPTFAHWNSCFALPLVASPCRSERYTDCLSIIYMYP